VKFWTYVGIAISCGGLALIATAWGVVAGKSRVDEQLPPMVWGGMIGLALIVAGLAVVSADARRHDQRERNRQLARLARALERDR
jgi:hypothetical protein